MPVACLPMLAVFCVAAAVSDLRTRRIPNLLNASGALCGAVLWTAHSGSEGLRSSLAGAGFGLGVLLVPFLLRMVGGGDVKFLAASGAIVGWPLAWPAFLAGAGLGGVVALAAMLLKRRSLKALEGEITLLISGCVSAPGTPGGPRIAYAVPLGAGLMLVACLNRL